MDQDFQALLPAEGLGTLELILSRNVEGLLTTSSGYVVQPQITIPNEQLDQHFKQWYSERNCARE